MNLRRVLMALLPLIPRVLLTHLGEIFLTSATVLDCWILMSPTPWSSSNPKHSTVYFTPYNEPLFYIAPNPECDNGASLNATVPIWDHPSVNSASYSHVATWLGPLGMLYLCFITND